MDRIYITLIGLTGGTLTTCSFIPQIWKLARSKRARDISLWMYLVLTTGIFLWLVYGFFLGELPIMLANAVAFVLCLTILIMKLSFKN